MRITYLYAALLAVLFLVLTFRTIFFRGSLRVALGDGESPALRRAIRAHANFSEYVPIALILLLMVESSGASSSIMHGLGAALVVGRLLHAIGISQIREPLKFRMFGMILTTGCIGVSAIFLFVAALR